MRAGERVQPAIERRLEALYRAALPERLRSDGLHRGEHILHTMAHFRDENVPVRLGAAAYRDVVDGDQNQVRPARALQLARIDQHNSPSDYARQAICHAALYHKRTRKFRHGVVFN